MSSYIFGKIDMSDYNIEEDVKYLNTIQKQPEEYDEFGQGYWKNISLYNASGSEQKAIKTREYLTRSRGMGERLLINDWPE